MNNVINYSISEKSFIEAYRLAAKATRKQLIWLCFGGVMLLLLGLFGPEKIKNLGWISLAGGIGGYFLTSLILARWQAKNHYKNYKSIQGQMSINLLNDGFIIQTEDGKNVAKWEKLLKWRENNRYLLIYLAPKLFYLVPKYQDGSQEFISSLQHSLHNHLGPPI